MHSYGQKCVECSSLSIQAIRKNAAHYPGIYRQVLPPTIDHLHKYTRSWRALNVCPCVTVWLVKWSSSGWYGIWPLTRWSWRRAISFSILALAIANWALTPTDNNRYWRCASLSDKRQWLILVEPWVFSSNWVKYVELSEHLPLIAILTMVLFNGHLEEVDAALQLTLKPTMSNLPREKGQWKATKCRNYYLLWSTATSWCHTAMAAPMGRAVGCFCRPKYLL